MSTAHPTRPAPRPRLVERARPRSAAAQAALLLAVALVLGACSSSQASTLRRAYLPLSLQRVAFDAPDTGAAPGTWTTRAPMPTARNGLGVATANGRLYAVGGSSVDAGAGANLATVEEYDPALGVWATRRSLPTARYGLGLAAATDGRLYAVGGSDGPSFYGATEAYDPATDSWTARAAMPTPRHGHGLALASNGRLYAIGGFNGTYLSTVEEYDPATDRWTSKRSMNTARAFLGVAAAANGKIYAIGGSNGASAASYLDVVEEYDPIADSWRTRTPAGIGRHGVAAVADDVGKVFVLGGYNATSGYLDLHQEYDPALDSWEIRAPLSTRRASIAAGRANGKVYVVGGYDSRNEPTVEEFTPYLTVGGSWITKPSLPQPRRDMAVVAGEDGRVYALTGRVQVDEACRSIAEAYDPRTSIWTELASPRRARCGAGAAATGGRVYLVGGADAGGQLSSLEEFDPRTNSWRDRANMLTAREGAGVVTGPNGHIYVAGGLSGGAPLRTLEEYDPGADRWTTRAPMPTARTHLALAAAPNGRLYALGGFTNAVDQYGYYYGSATARVEEYDPATDSWTTAPEMPFPSGLIAAATTATGSIAVVGGSDNYGARSSLRLFAPTTRTWTIPEDGRLPSYRSSVGLAAPNNGRLYAVGGSLWGYHPSAELEELDPDQLGRAPRQSSARDFLGAAVAGGRVYLAGGTYQRPNVDDVSRPQTLVQESDSSLNSWTSRAPLPTGRCGFGFVAAPNGRLYAIGGATGLSCSGSTADVLELDPAANSWTARAAMPTGRAMLAAALGSDGRIYAAGGSADGFLAAMEAYDPASNSWQRRASMPTARERLALVAAGDGRLYAIGGVGPTGVTDLVEQYDPATDRWIARRAMPTAREALGAAATADGKIVAIGGRDRSGAYLDTVELYDPATDSWTARRAMPNARYGLGVVARNGLIEAIAGFSGVYHAKVQEYDPRTDSWTLRPSLPPTG